MLFNQRTSRIIQQQFQQSGIKPLYYCVLQQVLKHAWRERFVEAPTGTNFLAKSRTFRDRMRWEVFKYRSDYAKRRHENLAHAFSGKFTHWEDIFCDHIGVDWRLVRDQGGSLSEWMHRFDDFACKICEHCGLFCPSSSSEPGASEPMFKKQRTGHHKLEDLPASHAAETWEKPALRWDTPSGHFAIISDCKPLVQVVTGYSPLSSSAYQPLMHRITNNLVGLLDCGYLPNCIHLEPVIWQKRELNMKADHQANHTMDVRKSWHQICPMPFPDMNLKEANFLIHFDGGTRGNDCSAAA